MTEVVNSISTMASRLVETVMINVDDFADSFLTCGTCFTGYDAGERAAKLMPCSHTICCSCLNRILETQMHSNTFRCPICRETISVPPGGAISFPPAFIVNQLLDLIATQRRDIVPKCRLHPNKELLFCETCDVVFCTDCRGRNHVSQSCGSSNVTMNCPSVFDVGTGPTSSISVVTDVTTPDASPSSTSDAASSPGAGALNHNVISFNVAIKRCTEIMLYKMQLCVQELNSAQDTVSAELERLAANKNVCIESINSKFAEITALVEHRHTELLDTVKRLSDDKHRALSEQLSLIESERDAIRRECNSLKGVLDVRSISKAISYLNEKLDMVTGLTEPRENAFLRYQDNPNQTGRNSYSTFDTMQTSTDFNRSPSQTASDCLGGVISNPAESETAAVVSMRSSRPNVQHADMDVHTSSGCSTTSEFSGQSLFSSNNTITRTDFRNAQRVSSATNASLTDIARCLAAFGRISVSTTYPALCTARLPSEFVMSLFSKALIRAVDYHGRPQLTGGTDPIEVKLVDPSGRSVPTELLDLGDGSYELTLRPFTSGLHQLSVNILSRPIRGSPFQLHVRQCQQRRWCLTEGSDGRGLIQPFAVTYGPYPLSDYGVDESDEISSDPTPTTVSSTRVLSANFIFLLDTGNSRLLVLNPDTGSIEATLQGEPLSDQAATGIAWSPDGLWIVNWRSRSIYLLDPRTDKVVRSIQSSHFIEPTSICRCPLTNRLFIADNGAGCVFSCQISTGHIEVFIGAPTSTFDSSTPLPSANVISPRSSFRSTASSIDKTPSDVSSVPFRSRLRTSTRSQESRSCKRIAGLCVSFDGTLVVSTSSSIKIFSPDGVQLNHLNIPKTAFTDTLDSNTNPLRTSTLPLNSVMNTESFSHSSVGSTLTLDTHFSGRDSMLLADNVGVDGVSLSSMQAPRSEQSGLSCGIRGQFGGVAVTALASVASNDRESDPFGACLLATYSDRKRSGIIVWPQCTWMSHNPTVITYDPDFGDHVAQLNTSAANRPKSVDWLMTRPDHFFSSQKPYLIEVEPPLRRLAGLVALANSRHLVVVDQGAQTVSRFRYA